MSSSWDEVESQLNKWKSASTRLFFQSSMGGVTAWCVGTLRHVSSAELHFGMDGVDGIDLLFVVNVHDARFKFVDNRDAWQFFAPGREKTTFGSVLEITLRPGGRVVFAELFREAIEVPPN